MATINRWITKLDDRINPIVLKELRQAVNGRFVAAVLGLFLLISLIVITVALMQIDPNNASQELGLETLLVLQGTLVCTCLLFLPVYTAIRMGAERSDTNTDLLFISTLRPRQIIGGKLAASVILGLLIYSACMPFMTLTYLLRGVDLPSIFLVLGMGFCIVVAAVALALFAACVSTSRGFRVMMGLGLLVAMVFTMFAAIGASVGITESGFASTIGSAEFWGIIGTWLAGVGCSVALLFSFSVALVSPPASNRALGVRLTVLAVYLCDSAMICIWAWATGDEELMEFFGAVGMIFGSGMLLVASCERDRWTDRLLRTVPRSSLWRYVAMLFYSGSLGGLMFGWLIVGLTWLGFWIADTQWMHMSEGSYDHMIQWVVGVPLFVTAYVLTARLLRDHLLGRWVKQEHTWALAAVIAGCCAGGPVVLELLTAGPDGWGPDQYGSVLSPAALVYDASTRINAIITAGAWTVIALALNGPWLYRQLCEFKRPPEPPEPTEVVKPSEASGVSGEAELKA